MLSPQLQALLERLAALKAADQTQAQKRLLKELEVLDADSAVGYVIQQAMKRGQIAGEAPGRHECPACGAAGPR